MGEMWSYDKVKRLDNKGQRWHFVSRYFFIEGVEDTPYELYFRNDERTECGLLRFERSKDNPYRDYVAVVTKIMNNARFRESLLDPETKDVWNKSWK
jgi:hypothetical protein